MGKKYEQWKKDVAAAERSFKVIRDGAESAQVDARLIDGGPMRARAVSRAKALRRQSDAAERKLLRLKSNPPAVDS